MERETKTFTTSSGIQVKIKTYLTGREANSIKEEMYKTMKIDLGSATQGGAVPIDSKITGEFLLAQEKNLLSTMVLSIGERTENILEALLDLKNSDYQEIVKEVNTIYQGNLTAVK